MSYLLKPLIIGAAYTIPFAILAGVVHLVFVRFFARVDRSDGPVRFLRRQDLRDEAFMLIGAALGAALSWTPIGLWAEVRLAAFLVLPAAGATAGLIASAVSPPTERMETVTASLRPRETLTYVTPSQWQLLHAACGMTVLISLIRWLLPPEVPIPTNTGLGSGWFRPDRGLYSVLATVALALGAATWVGARMIVRRSRPASDAEVLRSQERIRTRSVQRLLAWAAGTALLLDAAMLTALPSRMGGVIFGDFHAVQRATDVVTFALVVISATVIVRAYRPSSRDPELAVPLP